MIDVTTARKKKEWNHKSTHLGAEKQKMEENKEVYFDEFNIKVYWKLILEIKILFIFNNNNLMLSS